MPAHTVTSPQAALDHISLSGRENLPSNVAPGPFVTHSTAADETLVGHIGQTDYFVYDGIADNGTDFISGFESGVDVLVFEHNTAFKVLSSPDGDLIFSGGGGTITLLGVSAGEFDFDHDLLQLSGTFSI